MKNKQTYCDAFNLLVGKKLGEGIHRTVFQCRIRHDLVVKVENCDFRYFANVLEEKFWDDNRWNKPVARWLAPCEFLSPDGRILLQKRCDPIGKSKRLPAKLPAFLTDIKIENFGMLNGRLVCFDYALVNSEPSIRLRKADFN